MTGPNILEQAISRLRPLSPAQKKNAAEVLGRLRGDERAPGAIAAMTDDPAIAEKIVYCCIYADEVARDFKDMAAESREIPTRLDALKESTHALDIFVTELASSPRNSASAYVALEYGEEEYLRVALGRIAALIEARKTIAAQTVARLGITQKWSEGAQTAAIGQLAGGIGSITGRPHHAHVAVLAEAILDIDDIVSIDRVKHALRATQAKDWTAIRTGR